MAALEQMPGAASRGAVGRKPVKDNVEAKTQAFLLASPGHRTNRFLCGPGKAEVGAGLAEITDQQRRPTLRQKRIEAEIIDPKSCSLTEPPLPLVRRASAMDMINRGPPHLQLPTRAPHPG